PRRLFSSPLPCPHEHLLPDPNKLGPGKERNALCCPDFPPGKQLEKLPFQIIVPNDRTICFATKVTKLTKKSRLIPYLKNKNVNQPLRMTKQTEYTQNKQIKHIFN
ncbi:MAG TPA: hypothetical protein PKV50_06375, partial [Prolixibacteraceae bacterium]|nr:hypothetical protein [Prolixibacteraceae bacterium]